MTKTSKTDVGPVYMPEPAPKLPGMAFRKILNFLSTQTRVKRVVVIFLEAFAIAVLLIWALRLGKHDLSVPFNYWGDTLHFVSLVKGLIEDGWPSHLSRLSAPFGFDAVAFPSNSSTDWALMKLVTPVVTSPGTLLNVFWIGTFLLTGVLATVALIYLEIPLWLAVGGGMVYAILPAAFIRNVAHISLVYYTVPVLAAYCVHLASAGQTAQKSHPLFLLAIAAGIAQGFNYLYFSFFACFLLLVASGIGGVAVRSFVPLARAALVVAVISVATFANLWPSLSNWQRNGKPPDMSYKRPAEAEVYGLKLRRLLLPSETNAIDPLAHWARLDREAQFPNENENEAARLGPFAAVGFLAALGWLIWPRRRAASESRQLATVDAATKLLLVSFLVAAVGGFGAIFNTLILPDIRAYNRFSVFIAFFAVVVLCALLAEWSRTVHSRSMRILIASVATGLFLFSVYDQLLGAKRLTSRYSSDIAAAEFERAAVYALEAEIPRGGLVFQMPITDFPPDPGAERMGPYDHARMYLWSKHLRWSWPSFSNQHRAWVQSLVALRGNALAERLALSGFSAVWLDRYGYKDDGASIEAQLVSAGAVKLDIPGANRYAAFDLSPVTGRLQEALGSAAFIAERNAVLTGPGAYFGPGFYGQETTPDGLPFRWSQQSSTVTIRSFFEKPKTVKVSFSLQSGNPGSVTVASSGKILAEFMTTSAVSSHSLEVILPARSQVNLEFKMDGQQFVVPGETRTLFFALIDLRLTPAPTFN